MAWLQLRITSAREDAGKIEDALLAHGALSITFEDNADQPIFEPALGETPLWQDTRVTGLFEADVDTQRIAKTVADTCSITLDACHWHVLEDKDWEREWMQHFKPIQCADNFWICPSWCEPPAPNAVNLMLDPGLAFGTGTHPTTFLCLKWIAQAGVTGQDVIDYGCGSGILGIAARLLGAASVKGTDIDPQALLASAENAKRNGLERDEFQVFFPDNFAPPPADIVLANILAGPLVELSETLSALVRVGGAICLSGILDAQKHAVISAYTSTFDLSHIEEKNGWVCIAGRKLSL